MSRLANLDVDYGTLPRKGRWWVALSGGVDSVALLHSAAEWCREQDLPQPAAVHVHHGIHPAADAWVALCRRHCEQLQVALTVIHVDPIQHGAALELRARDARYRVFADLLASDDVLLMAHHQDDQVETVLFRLLRGAGPRGLSGMPAKRPLGRGWLVRPMLALSRECIERWATARGLDYIDDPGNSDRSFDRNYLRHEVIPLIALRWPGYRETVTRAAAIQADVLRDREDVTADIQDVNVAGEPTLYINDVKDASLLVLRLHRWLSGLGMLVPSRARLLAFSQQVVNAPADRLPQLAWGAHRVWRWRGRLHLSRDGVPSAMAAEATVGHPVRASWGELHWQAQDGPGLAAGARLTLRLAGSGERIAPRGRPSRPLSRWWQEFDVPPWWRQRLPLLCDADDGGVLAVLGCGLTESSANSVVQSGGLIPMWCPMPATVN